MISMMIVVSLTNCMSLTPSFITSTAGASFAIKNTLTHLSTKSTPNSTQSTMRPSTARDSAKSWTFPISTHLSKQRSTASFKNTGLSLTTKVNSSLSRTTAVSLNQVQQDPLQSRRFIMAQGRFLSCTNPSLPSKRLATFAKSIMVSGSSRLSLPQKLMRNMSPTLKTLSDDFASITSLSIKSHE